MFVIIITKMRRIFSEASQLHTNIQLHRARLALGQARKILSKPLPRLVHMRRRCCRHLTLAAAAAASYFQPVYVLQCVCRTNLRKYAIPYRRQPYSLYLQTTIYTINCSRICNLLRKIEKRSELYKSGSCASN